ncbi:MAG: hypothetical protein A2W22_02235 [Candidatus Levybacteria bacterium RBG_16_35_11]|nr:MAG: hypothetical protein A2W22_02235 [Candidatus Levybacteria bacterium RBG_16_35_11]
MDVIKLSENSIKIKGKKASFIVDPSNNMPKNIADAIVLLSNKVPDLDKVEGYRVVISGSGEYEVGRVKINGISTNDGLVYSFLIDGIDLLLGKATDLNSIADKNQEHKVVIIMADLEIKESVVTTIEPRLVILYGEKKDIAIKALGKEKGEVEFSKKLSFNEDRLPEEMGVAVLS